MNGIRPKFTRTPDGSLTAKACMDICRFWAEEADFEGNRTEANKWHHLFKDFRLSEDLGLHAWVTCPFIENKLAKEADKWKDRYVPWEDRRLLVEFS